MKNLFQNKKILFTLILMASCLGILGVGGEGEAASCSDSYCVQGDKSKCKSADAWCVRFVLKDGKCYFDGDPFGECTEPNTLCRQNSIVSYQWYCKSSWGACDCDRLAKVATCDNQCCKDWQGDSYSCDGGCCCNSWAKGSSSCLANNQIYQSRTCYYGGGSACMTDRTVCDSTNCKADAACNGKKPNDSCGSKKKCDNNCKCKSTSSVIPPSTICESVDTQVCCDTNINKCENTITSGPRACSGNLVCCQSESCIPKTTTNCKDKNNICTDGSACKNGCPNKCVGNTAFDWSCVGNKCVENETVCDSDEKCENGKCISGGTTPNPCYWINIGCNLNDECDNQEAEICGPSSCKGNCDGKSRGDTRCVLGSNCNENSGGGYTPDTNGGAVNFTNPLSTNSFEALVMGIINWILGIVVSLAILFLIIGGLMYITSAGDEERIKKAKNIILYAVVGLGVVILSWSIITELKDILGVK